MKELYNEKDDSAMHLAMAYVPWQRFKGINNDLEEAFKNGTIFPELDKPFLGRRSCKNE